MRAVIILLVAILLGGYEYYQSRQRALREAEAVSEATALLADSKTFQCDGRTRCTQMTSCAEATYFLKNCPNVQMDGDNDGIPCEQQWCH